MSSYLINYPQITCRVEIGVLSTRVTPHRNGLCPFILPLIAAAAALAASVRRFFPVRCSPNAATPRRISCRASVSPCHGKDGAPFIFPEDPRIRQSQPPTQALFGTEGSPGTLKVLLLQCAIGTTKLGPSRLSRCHVKKFVLLLFSGCGFGRPASHMGCLREKKHLQRLQQYLYICFLRKEDIDLQRVADSMK